jgi:phage terminase Nu1 subunit (DNA packaging protein)
MTLAKLKSCTPCRGLSLSLLARKFRHVANKKVEADREIKTFAEIAAERRKQQKLKNRQKGAGKKNKKG